MKKLILVLNVLFISSCSNLITKEDCKKDMLNMGLDHGKRGLSNLSDNIRRACDSGEQTISLEDYQTGFNRGWSAYCTSFNGFVMGKKGDNYKSFCPIEKEELFHEKFLIGKKVYEKKDQVIEVEEKIKELNQNTEKDLSTKDELNKAEEYLRELKREIQSLEQKGMSLVHTN
jgi:hypothetical protein